MKYLYSILFFLFLVGTQYSCNQEPDGGIPFYLSMDSARLVSSQTFGLNTKAISDVWVQTSTTNLDAYQFPCNFPVLAENYVSFLVQGGIIAAGSGTPEPYPFYNSDTFSIMATPGKKYSFIPTFTYKTSVAIAWTPPVVEDFENGLSYDSMTLCNNPQIVAYGRYCGQITVSPNDSSVIANQTTAPYSLASGDEVWLEFDYMCTVPFYVGINSYTSSGSTVTTTPIQFLFVVQQPTWTHLYVDFSAEISGLNASSYLLFFQALNPSGFGGGSVYLDNIKLLYQAN